MDYGYCVHDTVTIRGNLAVIEEFGSNDSISVRWVSNLSVQWVKFDANTFARTDGKRASKRSQDAFIEDRGYYYNSDTKGKKQKGTKNTTSNNCNSNKKKVASSRIDSSSSSSSKDSSGKPVISSKINTSTIKSVKKSSSKKSTKSVSTGREEIVPDSNDGTDTATDNYGSQMDDYVDLSAIFSRIISGDNTLNYCSDVNDKDAVANVNDSNDWLPDLLCNDDEAIDDEENASSPVDKSNDDITCSDVIECIPVIVEQEIIVDEEDVFETNDASINCGISLDEITQANEVRIKSLSVYKNLLKDFVPAYVYNELLSATSSSSSSSSSASSAAGTSSLFSRVYDIEAVAQPEMLNKECVMKHYQLQGLSYLLSQYHRRINCILADEMGLGKTLQTISFIASLITQKEPGQHLILAPLSVIHNWINELSKWCPLIKVLRFHSYDDKERRRLYKELIDLDRTQVIVVSYSSLTNTFTRNKLISRVYRTIIFDEGHKVKCDCTKLFETCLQFKSIFKVILTGTPVQNNLHETWSLMNMLMPSIFTDSTVFDNYQTGGVIDRTLLDKTHYLLRLMVLRRLKSEVELSLPPRYEMKINCPMEPLQIALIRTILLKESASIKESSNPSAISRLSNIIMQLRKASNHPFLFPNYESILTEEDLSNSISYDIVKCCGKMVLLDKLIDKLLLHDHRIIIFSQFTSMLDILGEYLNAKNIPYLSLDGRTSRVLREVRIEQFNRPNSKFNVFCISTRAGGEGINLFTADSVILYDSDWNPQLDLQAMARVHRIGQKKIVHVYRLVTEGSVEERIVQSAQNKLFLSSMVTRGSTAKSIELDTQADDDTGAIDDGNTGYAADGNDGTNGRSKANVFAAIKFGWNYIFSGRSIGNKYLTDDQISLIIKRQVAEPNVGNDTGTGSNISSISGSGTGTGTGTDSGSAELSEDVRKIMENQERNLLDFDENAPLTSACSMLAAEVDKYALEKISKKKSCCSKVVDTSNILTGKRVVKERYEYINVRGVGQLHILKDDDKSSVAVTNKSPAGPRNVAGKHYEYSLTCQHCHSIDEPFIYCNTCPAAWHGECIDALSYPRITKDKRWKCPHHRCVECKKIHSEASFLFRCEYCSSSYCEDCLPPTRIILGDSEAFALLGYVTPKTVCYVYCDITCAKAMNYDDGSNEYTDSSSSSSGSGNADEAEEYVTSSAKSFFDKKLNKSFCSDIRSRLNRTIVYDEHVCFTSMREVPNLCTRYMNASNHTKVLLHMIINKVTALKFKNVTSSIGYTAFTGTNSSSGSSSNNDPVTGTSVDTSGDTSSTSIAIPSAEAYTEASTEAVPVTQSSQIDTVTEESIDVVLSFSGCGHYTNAMTYYTIYFEVLKALQGLKQVELCNLLDVLGMCYVLPFIKQSKVDTATGNKAKAYTEPRFKFISKGMHQMNKHAMYEVVAAFICIPCPLNMMVALSSTIKLESLLLVSRLLETLGLSLVSSNHFMIPWSQYVHSKAIALSDYYLCPNIEPSRITRDVLALWMRCGNRFYRCLSDRHGISAVLYDHVAMIVNEKIDNICTSNGGTVEAAVGDTDAHNRRQLQLILLPRQLTAVVAKRAPLAVTKHQHSSATYHPRQCTTTTALSGTSSSSSGSSGGSCAIATDAKANAMQQALKCRQSIASKGSTKTQNIPSKTYAAAAAALRNPCFVSSFEKPVLGGVFMISTRALVPCHNGDIIRATYIDPYVKSHSFEGIVTLNTSNQFALSNIMNMVGDFTTNVLRCYRLTLTERYIPKFDTMTVDLTGNSSTAIVGNAYAASVDAYYGNTNGNIATTNSGGPYYTNTPMHYGNVDVAAATAASYAYTTSSITSTAVDGSCSSGCNTGASMYYGNADVTAVVYAYMDSNTSSTATTAAGTGSGYDTCASRHYGNVVGADVGYAYMDINIATTATATAAYGTGTGSSTGTGCDFPNNLAINGDADACISSQAVLASSCFAYTGAAVSTAEAHCDNNTSTHTAGFDVDDTSASTYGDR